MTQDEIIEMAREVGLPHWNQTKEVVNIELLEAFAKLVAEKAVAIEREACAKVCEQWDASHPQRIAAAIRARGQA